MHSKSVLPGVLDNDTKRYIAGSIALGYDELMTIVHGYIKMLHSSFMPDNTSSEHHQADQDMCIGGISEKARGCQEDREKSVRETNRTGGAKGRRTGRMGARMRWENGRG